MSLVNQVLQDLQQRRTEHPDTSGLLAAAPAPRPRSGGRWALVGGAAVLLGLALFAVQHYLLAPAPAPVQTPVGATPVGATLSASRLPEAPLTVEETLVEETLVETPLVETPPVEAPLVEETTVGATLPASRLPETAPATATTTPEPEPTLTRTLVTTSPQQRADTAYGAGVRALSEGRRSAAESQFREALGHDASHADARLALANLLAGSGALREAEAQLQQGLRIAPHAAPLAERYARLLFERGDLAGAIGVLVDAAPPVAADLEYHALLAALQQRAGNHVAAADTYSSLVGARPEQGLWWMGLGISLEAEQRNAAAHDAYQRAARDARLSAQVAAFVRERLAALEPTGATP